MSDAWKDRQRAFEDQYFDKINQSAMERMKSKEVRKSPITGEPMEQVTILGVNIDRCKTTGGIWLDAGELEEILNKSKNGNEAEQQSWTQNFFNNLFKAK